MARMIATSRPSKNQYFTNKAQDVFRRARANDLSLFSGSAMVADFSVYMDGVNVFFLVLLSADGLFGIVTALANDALVFNLDSFMASLNNPRKSEGEAEEEEEEEKVNLRKNQDFIDMYVYIYITKEQEEKKNRKYQQFFDAHLYGGIIHKKQGEPIDK